MNKSVIIFLRYPDPGKTKTRLIPKLGAEGAASLSKQLAEVTFLKVMSFSRKARATVDLRFTGRSKDDFISWLGGGGNNFECSCQAKGDLGLRMCRAFSDRFSAGSGSFVLIGTDCPGITEDILEQAFAALENHELVLGPALDGGYYLIGLSKESEFLFENIQWGTDSVLAATLARANEHALKTCLLEELGDIDRPEDLHLLSSLDGQ